MTSPSSPALSTPNHRPRPAGQRVIHGLAAAALGLLAISAPAWAADPGHIGYVPVTGENSVYVVDTDTQAVLQKIPNVGEHPTVLRALPDHSKIYVDNFGPLSAKIGVIDTASNTLSKQIATLGLPYASLTLSHDGRYLYVPTSLSVVQVIDTRTDSVVRTFTLPASPLGIEISPDDQTLYVFLGTSAVVALDAQTGAQLHAPLWTQGLGPEWGALTGDGSKLYAINTLSDNIAVIDTHAWTVTKTLATGAGSAPVSGTLTPDSQQLYVANIGTRQLAIIDTRSDSIVKTIATSNAPVVVGFSADGKRAYLSDLGKASFAYVPPLAGIAIGISFFTLPPGLPGNIVTYDTASYQTVGHPISTGTGPVVGVYN